MTEHVIVRVPLRVSFFGGGTDYPEWYLKHGGSVLSTTIDKYCFVECRRFPLVEDNDRYRVRWSHNEVVSKVDEILHPAVRVGLKRMGFDKDPDTGIEILHKADLPSRMGLGSSSSFVVGLLVGLSRLKGEDWDNETLLDEVNALQRDELNETVGMQDQMAAIYGGLNLFDYRRDGLIGVNSCTDKVKPESLKKIEDALILISTGESRLSSTIAASTVTSMTTDEQIFKLLMDMVPTGLGYISGGFSEDFGGLLGKSWILKKSIGQVSSPSIDSIYNRGIDHGALGGKLLGAGGGGFLLFCVPESIQDDFKRHMLPYRSVPFKFTPKGYEVLHCQ